MRIEDVHPLQLGIARRIVRTQRRHGFPIVNPLRFYPHRAAELLAEVVSWLWLLGRYRAIAKRIEKDPDAKGYMDAALAPIPDDPVKDHLVELFADKIPKTHGAPLREPTRAVADEASIRHRPQDSENARRLTTLELLVPVVNQAIK